MSLLGARGQLTANVQHWHSRIRNQAMFLWLPLLRPHGRLLCFSGFLNQNVIKCGHMWMPGRFVGCVPDGVRSRHCVGVLGRFERQKPSVREKIDQLGKFFLSAEYNQFLFILPVGPNVHFLASLCVSVDCARDTHYCEYLQQLHLAAEECLEIVRKWVFLLNLYEGR